MAMNHVTCTDCGKPWPLGQVTCSCGGTKKTHHAALAIEARSNVEASWTLSRVAWEKNWPLIALYLLLQIGLAGGSFWTSGWLSVGYSVFGSLISTILGLFIVVKTITKTSG